MFLKNVYIRLQGGIGNRLFQICFLIHMKHIFPNHRYYYYFNENKSHNTNHNWCIHLLQQFKISYRNVLQHK